MHPCYTTTHSFDDVHQKLMSTPLPLIPGTVLPRLSVPRLTETQLSERSSERAWSLCKMVFSLKLQTLRLSRVHVFVCYI